MIAASGIVPHFQRSAEAASSFETAGIVYTTFLPIDDLREALRVKAIRACSYSGDPGFSERNTGFS
jgi:hypothetical protein